MSIVKSIRNAFLKEEKQGIRKEKEIKKKDPPPRHGEPDLGDRTLVITDEVMHQIITAAYLVGDCEISGVGLIEDHGDTIRWTKAWIISDIEELKEEYEDAEPKYITREVDGGKVLIKNPDYDVAVSRASSMSVRIDSQKMADLLYKTVESGGDPANLRLYWHTHGIGRSFWSSLDLKAVDNEVKTSGGNEIINVVMSPGSIMARIDSGLDDDKQAESVLVKMEDTDAERYRELGDVRSSRALVSYGGFAGGLYGWGWSSWEYDGTWVGSNRGRIEEVRGYDDLDDAISGRFPSRQFPHGCPDCGSFQTEDVELVDGEYATVCKFCRRCLGGELDGVRILQSDLSY